MSVRHSVHLENSAPTEWLFMKFYTLVFFEILSRIIKFLFNLTRIAGTLREDQYIFMIMSRLCLLRMRYVSDKCK